MYNPRPNTCHGSAPIAALIAWLLVFSAFAWALHRALPFRPF